MERSMRFWKERGGKEQVQWVCKGLRVSSWGGFTHGLTLKFESRDEWLGIRDWGLGIRGKR